MALALYLETEKYLFALAGKMKSQGYSIFLRDSCVLDLYMAQLRYLDENYVTNIPEEVYNPLPVYQKIQLRRNKGYCYFFIKNMYFLCTECVSFISVY
ncbi:hypothetical protein OXB_2652 [Bacillus sp. OxB-1]|nr:hypothetical protein OXB_2652 [Bacillus sp. OxB-1]